MTFTEILAPALDAILITVVLLAMLNLVNLFLKKTKTGNRIKNATPWMGWYQDVDDDYTNFVIHPANYYHPQSSHR